MTKKILTNTIRSVPIAGKTYEEYVEAVAYKLISEGYERGEQEDMGIITDLLTDFDEMGFIPTTAVPDPEAYAIEWRNKMTNALQGYRKASDVAREIFDEINELKKPYASGYIDGNALYVQLYILEKKYTEGEG